jgi:hypothetical protein
VPSKELFRQRGGENYPIAVCAPGVDFCEWLVVDKKALRDIDLATQLVSLK